MDPASRWRPCAPPMLRPIDNHHQVQRAAPQGDSHA